MPISDLFATSDAAWQPSASAALPGDALAYVPGDYGERYLLRVVAKYGPEALFQGGADGPSRVSGRLAQ
jgi:hypothetical protein